MKHVIIFLLIIGSNPVLHGQNIKYDNDKLLKKIAETVQQADKKIVLYKNPHKNQLAYKEYYQIPGRSKTETKSSNNKTLFVKKGNHRFYFISSKKFDNTATLKIFRVNKNKKDKLLYSLKDKPDNVPSFIDVHFGETGEYRFRVSFKGKKTGYALWVMGKVIE